MHNMHTHTYSQTCTRSQTYINTVKKNTNIQRHTKMHTQITIFTRQLYTRTFTHADAFVNPTFIKIDMQTHTKMHTHARCLTLTYRGFDL